MGRKAEFSDDEIIAAGNLIKSEGKLVSPYAIRNRLDGGSSPRLKAVWTAYEKGQANNESIHGTQQNFDLPHEIKEVLERNQELALKHLESSAIESYRIAQKAAEKRVSLTFEEHKLKINDYEESELQASIAIERSDKKNDELNLELEVVVAEKDRLQSENSRLAGQIESFHEQVKQLQQKESAFIELQREFGKLEGKNEFLMQNQKS
jgi:cation transport regulator ChaB